MYKLWKKKLSSSIHRVYVFTYLCICVYMYRCLCVKSLEASLLELYSIHSMYEWAYVCLSVYSYVCIYMYEVIGVCLLLHLLSCICVYMCLWTFCFLFFLTDLRELKEFRVFPWPQGVPNPTKLSSVLSEKSLLNDFSNCWLP